jgi:hypothetical protein
MKKLYLFLVIIFFAGIKLHAQQNLQFNQVILVNTTAQTVPSGKVWKITGFMPSIGFRSTSGSTSPYEYLIQVNGVNRVFGHGSYMNTSYGVAFPISNINSEFWLPAGTTLAAGSNVGEISVIEFNIVP